MKVAFRGGYVEDEAGDRWWSEELLVRTERQRDASREEIERLDASLLKIKQERDRLRRELSKVLGSLVEALELCEEGWSYADPFYQQKWDYAVRFNKLVDVVEKLKKRTGPVTKRRDENDS